MKLKTIIGEVEVRFYHRRDTVPEKTEAVITMPRKFGFYEPFRGIALKNPTDQFNKRVGRKLALSRALKHNLPKEKRRVIWEAYQKYTGGY